MALFAKELHSYTENVNEIDDETTQLLSETILTLSKLQIGSKYRETPFTNVNQFVTNLNDEVFKCRRYIVCCLCQVMNLTKINTIRIVNTDKFLFCRSNFL